MVDPQTWARFNQLLNSALESSGVSQTLSILSQGWRELTGAELAYISLKRHTIERRASISSLPDGTASREVDSESITPESEADVRPAERASASASPSTVSPSTVSPSTVASGSSSASERVIALQVDMPGSHLCVVGSVTLLPAKGGRLNDSIIPELTNLTGRLITQALERESLLTPDDLLQAKLESLAELAAGAGHEINNPLATIAGRAALLLKDETNPERRQALTTIGGQAYRIRDMIGDLMLFGRPPQPTPEAIDLAKVVASVVNRLDEQLAVCSCHLKTNIDVGLTLWADPVQFSVFLSNLLQNSLDAIDDGGTIRLTARATGKTNHSRPRQRSSAKRDSQRKDTSSTTAGTRPPASPVSGHVVLTISDTGPGLNEVERAHLFDPFFSGRQAGRGLGFGLSKCWRIVTMHGGSIEVVPQTDTGLTLKVVWPSCGDADNS